jgi:hypothetical protein
MKKVILILVLISNAYQSYSQSKGDTQIWIKSTIENYARRDIYPLLNIYFSGEDFWITELEEGGSINREMPIKQINQVSIKLENGGYTLILGCTYDGACIKSKRYRVSPTGTAISVPTDIPDRFNTTIYLDRSLENDDMIRRLKTALTHLIVLNGGKVVSEVF